MTIKNVLIKDLTPYAKNAKKHDNDQVKQVANSIEQFGMVQPIVADKNNNIVIGHCRLMACKKLKMKEVPVLYVEDLTKEQIDALRLADNKTNESEWDFDLLGDSLNEVLNIDMSDFGFDLLEDEKEKEIIEDEVPEVSDLPPIAKHGDVWKLGRHRLMCGDSTNVEDIEKIMGGVKADMVFTDPPYGIDYGGGRTQVVSGKNHGKLKNDDLQGKNLGNLISQVFLHNKNEADVYICVSPIMQKPFLDNIENQGKNINAVIVWDKKQPGLGYMAYRRQCEFILFCKGKTFKKGDSSDFDLWPISRGNGQDYVHGTQKPVAVPARAIQNSSKKDDSVLDLFGGSGSTLIACEQTERVCYMMELDPKYVDVIIKRWENLTGQKACLINGCENI